MSNHKLFERLIKRTNPNHQDPFIFMLNRELFWTQHHFIVKDSTGLEDYFGHFAISQIKDGNIYNLDKSSPIRISYESKRDKDFFNNIGLPFKDNISYHKILLPCHDEEEFHVASSRHKIQCRLLFVEGSTETVRINKDYFDYITSVIRGQYTMHQNHKGTICFRKGDNTFAILAPIYKVKEITREIIV